MAIGPSKKQKTNKFSKHIFKNTTTTTPPHHHHHHHHHQQQQRQQQRQRQHHKKPLQATLKTIITNNHLSPHKTNNTSTKPYQTPSNHPKKRHFHNFQSKAQSPPRRSSPQVITEPSWRIAAKAAEVACGVGVGVIQLLYMGIVGVV